MQMEELNKIQGLQTFFFNQKWINSPVYTGTSGTMLADVEGGLSLPTWGSGVQQTCNFCALIVVYED